MNFVRFGKEKWDGVVNLSEFDSKQKNLTKKLHKISTKVFVNIPIVNEFLHMTFFIDFSFSSELNCIQNQLKENEISNFKIFQNLRKGFHSLQHQPVYKGLIGNVKICLQFQAFAGIFFLLCCICRLKLGIKL